MHEGMIISSGITMEPIVLQEDAFFLPHHCQDDKRYVRCQLHQKHQKVESHAAAGSVVITLKSHAYPDRCMIHAPIAVADGQYAKSCYDRWGPKHQHALFPGKM